MIMNILNLLFDGLSLGQIELQEFGLLLLIIFEGIKLLVDFVDEILGVFLLVVEIGCVFDDVFCQGDIFLLYLVNDFVVVCII